MIIELLYAILILALSVIALGYYSGDEWFTFIGLFFLFILGLTIIGNGIDYKTGETMTGTYQYNPGTCSGNCTQPPTLYMSSETTTYNYESFTGTYAHWFGFLLCTGSVFGMSMIFLKFKRSRREE